MTGEETVAQLQSGFRSMRRSPILLEDHVTVREVLGAPGMHHLLQNLDLVVNRVDFHSFVNANERSLVGGGDASPNHHRFREKGPRANPSLSGVPVSGIEQLVVILAVARHFHHENLLVGEEDILDAIPLEMRQEFLGFLQPAFFCFVRECLSLKQTVRTKP